MSLFWEPSFYKVQLKVLHHPSQGACTCCCSLVSSMLPFAFDVAANSQEAPPPTEAFSSPAPWLQWLAVAVTAFHTHLPASLTPHLSATHGFKIGRAHV